MQSIERFRKKAMISNNLNLLHGHLLRHHLNSWTKNVLLVPQSSAGVISDFHSKAVSKGWQSGSQFATLTLILIFYFENMKTFTCINLITRHSSICMPARSDQNCELTFGLSSQWLQILLTQADFLESVFWDTHFLHSVPTLSILPGKILTEFPIRSWAMQKSFCTVQAQKLCRWSHFNPNILKTRILYL